MHFLVDRHDSDGLKMRGEGEGCSESDCVALNGGSGWQSYICFGSFEEMLGSPRAPEINHL